MMRSHNMRRSKFARLIETEGLLVRNFEPEDQHYQTTVSAAIHAANRAQEATPAPRMMSSEELVTICRLLREVEDMTLSRQVFENARRLREKIAG